MHQYIDLEQTSIRPPITQSKLCYENKERKQISFELPFALQLAASVLAPSKKKNTNTHSQITRKCASKTLLAMQIVSQRLCRSLPLASSSLPSTTNKQKNTRHHRRGGTRNLSTIPQKTRRTRFTPLDNDYVTPAMTSICRPSCVALRFCLLAKPCCTAPPRHL